MQPPWRGLEGDKAAVTITRQPQGLPHGKQIIVIIIIIIIIIIIKMCSGITSHTSHGHKTGMGTRETNPKRETPK